MIHVIGNSHVSIFTGQNVMVPIWPEKHILDKLPYFRTYRLGPVIAYNFYEHHLDKVLEIISTVEIPKTDQILFCVGEVDCRWHLPKQAQTQNKSISTIVDECIARYFRAIQHIKSIGHTPLVWCAHPSCRSGHDDDLEKPVFGDCAERVKTAKYFNDYLGNICNKNNIKFISIFDKLLDKDGLTNSYYMADYCHLNAEKVMSMVLDEFKLLKLICI